MTERNNALTFNVNVKRQFPTLSLLQLACVIMFALAVIVYDLAVYLAMFEDEKLAKYGKLASSVSAGIMSLTLIIIMSKVSI